MQSTARKSRLENDPLSCEEVKLCSLSVKFSIFLRQAVALQWGISDGSVKLAFEAPSDNCEKMWATKQNSQNNKAFVDSKLRPRCTTDAEQNLVRISAVMLVIFCRHVPVHMTHSRTILRKHNVHDPQNQKYITSQRRQRTEPQPYATCTENLVKFGHVVFDLTSEHSYTTGIKPHLRLITSE